MPTGTALLFGGPVGTALPFGGATESPGKRTLSCGGPIEPPRGTALSFGGPMESPWRTTLPCCGPMESPGGTSLSCLGPTSPGGTSLNVSFGRPVVEGGLSGRGVVSVGGPGGASSEAEEADLVTPPSPQRSTPPFNKHLRTLAGSTTQVGDGGARP